MERDSYKRFPLDFLDVGQPIPDKSAIESDRSKEICSLPTFDGFGTDTPSFRELVATQQTTLSLFGTLNTLLWHASTRNHMREQETLRLEAGSYFK
jgi:hypothetical protein